MLSLHQGPLPLLKLLQLISHLTSLYIIHDAHSTRALFSFYSRNIVSISVLGSIYDSYSMTRVGYCTCYNISDQPYCMCSIVSFLDMYLLDPLVVFCFLAGEEINYIICLVRIIGGRR
jgi:hypothetical protein